MIKIDQPETHPRVGEFVCHYLNSVPYKVLKRLKINGVFYLEIEVSGEGIRVPLAACRLAPQIGDQVVVVSGPYFEWVRFQAAQMRGNGKYPSRQMADFVQQEEQETEWACRIFTLERITVDMAQIRAGALRHEVPIRCLRVYHRERSA